MLDTSQLLEVLRQHLLQMYVQHTMQPSVLSIDGPYHRHWRTLLNPDVRFTVGEGSRHQQLVISFILGLQNARVKTPGTYPDRLSLNVGRQTLTTNNTITRTRLAYMINCRQHWLALYAILYKLCIYSYSLTNHLYCTVVLTQSGRTFCSVELSRFVCCM